MIRLIIIAIGLFLAWVLLASSFSKRQKIIICIGALLVSAAGLWFEQAGETPKENLITIEQLIDCGVSAQHSYRTNYDVEFCLRNTSPTATAKRVSIRFIALTCPAGECEEIQSIDREFPLSLAPDSSKTFKENLDFDKVDASLESVVWIAKVLVVKAVK